MAVIITGCSSVGKTTLAKKLLKKFKQLAIVNSVTTRSNREDDFNYEYVDELKFKDMLKNEEFAYSDEVFPGVFYANKLSSFGRIYLDNKIPLIVTDPKGAEFYQDILTHSGVINLIPKDKSIVKERIATKRSSNVFDRLDKFEEEISYKGGNVYELTELSEVEDEIFDLVKFFFKHWK